MRRNYLSVYATALSMGAALLVSQGSSAAEIIRVAYAGSMGVVMDRVIGPAFAKVHGAEYQGIGQGSYGLARQLEGKLIQADVFLPITPGPVDILKKAGLIGAAVPVASTQMVIAYSNKSRFRAEFEAAAQGKRLWYDVLRTAGLRFGRTDPATDPQGQNIIFTVLLAQNFYKQPALAEQILGGYQNPQQIFTESSMLSRLEGGQLDACSGYLSAAKSHNLPFITLPDEINLSNPDLDAKWYKSVQFAITLPTGKDVKLNTQPLVFYAAVLKNSRQPALAEKFLQFLQSPEGQKLFKDNGYSPPKGSVIQ